MNIDTNTINKGKRDVIIGKEKNKTKTQNWQHRVHKKKKNKTKTQNWQHRVHKKKKNKTKTQHNMCWTPQYTNKNKLRK